MSRARSFTLAVIGLVLTALACYQMPDHGLQTWIVYAGGMATGAVLAIGAKR